MMVFQKQRAFILTVASCGIDIIGAYSGTAEEDTSTSEQKVGRDTDSSTFEAIIIGAGWSGLGAAKTLQEDGCDDFVILDAHDYVGGRSKTIEVYDDVWGEVGSVFLNGIGDNPVFDIAVDNDIGYSYDYGNWELFQDGIRHADADEVTTLFGTYYAGIYDMWGEMYEDLTSISTIDTVLGEYTSKLGIENDPDKQALLNAAAEITVRYEYAADTSKFSALAGNWDVALIGDHVVPDGGFSGIVDAYAKSLLSRIKLSSKVTKVDYSTDPVEVTYVDDNGEIVTIRGKKVLVTLPVGVLKAGTVEFVPAFSEQGDAGRKKQAAIDHLNPGQLEKVALYWRDMTEDDIFWNVDVEYVLHVEEDAAQQGNFTYWNNFYGNNQVPMLVTFATGQFADAIQELTDDEVVAQAVERLRSIYGDENVVPEPTHHLVTRWQSEEFTKTTYSYATVGADAGIRGDLFEALDDRLFFAGEATCEYSYGTVHGSINSGIKAGQYMQGKKLRPAVAWFFHYIFVPTSDFCTVGDSSTYFWFLCCPN